MYHELSNTLEENATSRFFYNTYSGIISIVTKYNAIIEKKTWKIDPTNDPFHLLKTAQVIWCYSIWN